MSKIYTFNFLTYCYENDRDFMVNFGCFLCVYSINFVSFFLRIVKGDENCDFVLCIDVLGVF